MSEEPQSLAHAGAATERLVAKVHAAVERHAEAIACIYLFGSAARGEAGPLSDLDVGIVFAEAVAPQARMEIAAALAGELQEMSGALVDVTILDEAPPALKHGAIRDGRLVFVADEARRVHFEATAIREYLDFRPVLTRYDRELFQRAREGRFGT